MRPRFAASAGAWTSAAVRNKIDGKKVREPCMESLVPAAIEATAKREENRSVSRNAVRGVRARVALENQVRGGEIFGARRYSAICAGRATARGGLRSVALAAVAGARGPTPGPARPLSRDRGARKQC